MAIFSNNKEAEVAALNQQIDTLNQQIQDGAKRRKKLAQMLTEEREKVAALEIRLGKAIADLNDAKRSVARTRKIARASVERANRFKDKLTRAFRPSQGS